MSKKIFFCLEKNKNKMNVVYSSRPPTAYKCSFLRFFHRRAIIRFYYNIVCRENRKLNLID